MSQHVLNDSSQSPSGALSAPPTRLIPSSTDFNILATMLQDIAQVLLKYGVPEPNADAKADTEENATTKIYAEVKADAGTYADAEKSSHKESLEKLEQDEPSAKEQVITFSYDTEGKTMPAYHKIHIDALDQYQQGEFHDEIRCFHLSESNVREERALLKKHDCIHLTEFLYQIHDELSMFVNLLSYVDNDIVLPAKVLQQAFYRMELVLENLEELRKHMEKYEQVHKELVHTELINTAVIPE
jgi:predicted metalloendopeptidase